MGTLAIVYVVFMLIFGLLFLIDCIRYRKEINIYVRYGLAFGLLVVMFDVAIASLIANFFATVPAYTLVAGETVVLVKITLFTCMGMYCCSLLACSDLPLIKSFLGKSEAQGNVITANYLLSIAGVALGGILFSVVLFALTSPQMSGYVRELSEAQAAKFGVLGGPTLFGALFVLEFALAEELVFRLGIQNYLARQFRLEGNKYWVAIVATTGIWSLAHVGVLDPTWVKIVQVFPVGVALGILFKKYGTESCIFAHGAFNLGMMFLSPLLIT